MRKQILVLATALPLTFTSAMLTSPAIADDSGYGIEEITVTARKHEESLKDAPLSVTAVTSQMLDNRGAEQISAAADIAPNVNFSFGGTTSGSGSAAVVYIRGVGQNDFTPSTDPGVGIYIDGVYLGRTIGSVLDILDIERMEVLRGPQGTLFGRNTIGGAISLITKSPGEKWEGRVRAIGGDDNRIEIHGTVSGPLSDSVGIVASAMYRKRDGSVKRVLVGDELGDDDVYGGRVKLVFDASDRLNIALALDTVRERESGAPEVAVDVIENAPFSNFFNNNTFGNGSTDSANCAGGGSVTNPECQNDRWVGAPYSSYETGPNVNNVDTFGATLTLDYEFGDSVNFKSITAYRDLDARFARASDGSPFDIFATEDDYEQEQFSQEFQLIGGSQNGKVDWVGGLYYFTEEATQDGVVSAIIAPAFPRDSEGTTDNDNWAVYAEAVLHATDRLHLTGGLRYTDETKRYTPYLFIIPPGVFTIPNVAQPELNFEEVTWRASVAYDLADTVSTYVTASKGFKSGGYDFRVSTPTIDGLSPTYEPEFVTMYEVGLKAELDTLRLGLAVFDSDYEDMQVAQNVPPEVNTTTSNVATAEIRGLEAEFQWVPTSSLLIEGALGWQNAKYTELGAGAIAAGLSLSDDLIRTPDFSANLGISYMWNFDRGSSFRTRFDWIKKSRIHFEPVNDDFVSENGYDVFNVSATYESVDAEWAVTAGLNNVTDEEYMVAGDSNRGIGYRLAAFARPANWYLRVDYNF